LKKEGLGGFNLGNNTILTSLPGVDSPVEQRLAKQFFFGKGKDFFLTQGETSRLNQKPDTSEFNFGIGRLNPGPNGRIDVFDFDLQPFEVDLGNTFDPNRSIFVNRTPIGEVGTRFGNFIGETFGGEAFDIFSAPVIDPATPISGVFNGIGASGGFVLYPGKPNTNMLNRVYSK